MKLSLGLWTSGGLPNSVADPRRRLWMEREDAMDAAGTMEVILQKAEADEMSICDGDGRGRWI